MSYLSPHPVHRPLDAVHVELFTVASHPGASETRRAAVSGAGLRHRPPSTGTWTAAGAGQSTGDRGPVSAAPAHVLHLHDAVDVRALVVHC